MTVLVRVFQRKRINRIYTGKQKDTYYGRLAQTITKAAKSHDLPAAT